MTTSRASFFGLLGVFVALSTLFLLGGRAQAQTPTPTFAQQVAAAKTADEVFNLLTTRAGSTANLDAQMAARMKVNGLGLNALRQEAPAAAKLMTRRMMLVGVLPRAAAFLGPVGVSIGAAYTLCDVVLGCFKAKVTSVPGSMGNYVVDRVTTKAGEGPRVVTVGADGCYTWRELVSGATADQTYSRCATSQPYPTAARQALPAPGDYFVAGVDSAVTPYPSRNRIWMDGSGANGSVYLPPAPVEGYSVNVSTETYRRSSSWTDGKVWTATKPAEDAVDVSRTDTCETSPNCGTYTRSDDAIWPKQLRDALADALELSKKLAHELYPNEVRDPFATTTTIPRVQPNDTYDDYRKRLMDAGLLGRVIVRPDPNPRFGPDVVMDVVPRPGSTVKLDSEVRVYANPSFAPDPDTGSDSWADPWEKTDPETGLPTETKPAPAVPNAPGDQCSLTPPKKDFDMSPFSRLDADRFPLSVLPWARNLLASFNASGSAEAPDWAIKFGPVSAPILGWLPRLEGTFGTFWGWVRSLLGALVWVGAAFGFYRQTFGRA